MTLTSEAVVMRQPGGPEVLELKTVDLGWPGANDEVLVRMEAAGVNPADTFFRALGPYLGDGRGVVLGHDGAGVVEAVGSSVTSVDVGDRVAFCNGGVGGDPGTYSRYTMVPEWLLTKIPAGVDSTLAAAVPLVFITGWEALVERVRLKEGETVLIHAGAGGTGQVAIQIAQGLGASVATTVSSEAKAELVRALGAERMIDYTTEDFVAAAKEWTQGRGLDAALDNVGPEVLQKTYEAMSPYGRIATLMGTPGDVEGEIAYNHNLSIHNVMMLTPMWLGLDAERRRQGEIVRTAMDWLQQGKLRVEAISVYPWREAAEAHRRLEAGGMTGKAVLVFD